MSGVVEVTYWHIDHHEISSILPKSTVYFTVLIADFHYSSTSDLLISVPFSSNYLFKQRHKIVPNHVKIKLIFQNISFK